MTTCTWRWGWNVSLRVLNPKERDNESGLDYFGARYYSNAQGRFTSVDPSQLSVKLIDPQSWNRYSYTINNPLIYVDPNGRWPKSIHERIIDKALPGLTRIESSMLKKASERVDSTVVRYEMHEPGKYWFNGQNPINAYQHAMRAPNQSVEMAKEKTASFVSSHEQAAVSIQKHYEERGGEGLSYGALYEFGIAAHAVTDETSPAHTDQNGDPKVWSLGPSDLLLGDTITEHNKAEENISEAQLSIAVKALQDAFRATFGEDALKQAMTDPNKRKPYAPRKRKEEEE